MEHHEPLTSLERLAMAAAIAAAALLMSMAAPSADELRTDAPPAVGANPQQESQSAR
jgi:hypothetical protein